jgi:BRCA1-associated protein
MRTYYFHLTFELSPKRQDKVAGSGIDTKFPVIPRAGADIFQEPIQLQKIISWGIQLDQLDERPTHQRSSTDPQPATARGKVGAKSSRTAEKLQQATAAKASQKSSTPKKDWRYEDISIVSIDMAAQRPDEQPPGRGKSAANLKSKDPLSNNTSIRGVYVPSEPKIADLGYGIVHLYRDVDPTPELLEDANPASEGSSAQAEKFDPEDCTTLCILAVPAYMTPSDLLGFVGESTREHVSHFRLIRTGRVNKYMVLLKFRDAKKAKAWQKAWNGKPFNSMEVCQPSILSRPQVLLILKARVLPCCLHQVYYVPQFGQQRAKLEFSKHEQRSFCTITPKHRKFIYSRISNCNNIKR